MSMSRFDWDETEKHFTTVMQQLEHLVSECASFCRALEDKGEFLDKRHDRLRGLRRNFSSMTRDCVKLQHDLETMKAKIDAEEIPDTKIPPDGWWSK